jgi:bacillithiol biosynthesis deacetylase BshB2
MSKHLLVVLPHPDDETMACGGTIALHAREGTPVTYLCGTLGEMGRNMGNPPFATRESLPLLREAELREACAVLGVTDLRLMGLRDKTVEFLDPEWLAGRIRAVIDELKPHLILTYHPLYSVHPDHMAMGAAVVRAVAGMKPEDRPPVHTRAFGSGLKNLGPADLVVDVTPVLDIKMKAIAAHRSQTQLMLARFEKEAELKPELRDQYMKQRSQEPVWIYQF